MGEVLRLGAPTVIESYADKSPYGAVFEDDGKLGYFYAVDTRSGDSAVLDALCVYHITAVVNHPTPELDAFHHYDARIVWSADQQHVALLLDGYAHAAFDFEHKRAYCRSNFPTGSAWSPEHAWDQRAVDFLDALSEQVAQPAAKYTTLP
ncbi:MAG TPA: DUF2251 domain-containing protein [Gemmatimonadaceae bacterium]|jgi:hypothetical protein|nr:DUF2251 domain-containing protein [Gemmatimonadaceae bacterium]